MLKAIQLTDTLHNTTNCLVEMEQNNFYLTMKPLVIVCKILGIVPYTFINNKIQVSKYTLYYIVALIIMYLAIGSEAFYIPSEMYETSLLFSTEMVQTSASTTQVIITFINTAANKQAFTDLLKSFIENDNNFQQLCTSLPQGVTGKQILVHGIIRIVYLMVFSTLSIYSFWYYFDLPFKIINITRFMFPLILNSMTCYFASLHVLRLKSQFSILNNALKEQRVLNNRRHIRTAWETKKIIPLNKICSLHLHLCKTITSWNNTFGYVLLASFAVTFISILLSLYYCYLSAEDHEWNTLIGAAALCLNYIGEVMLLCYVCDSTTEEVSIQGV